MVARSPIPALLALPVLAALGCEATAPPPRPARTVGNSRRVGPAAARAGAGEQGPPRVDSAARCAPDALAALRRIVGARHASFGPLCTDVYNGRFSAVFATGEGEEVSDVWVVFHDNRNDEIHRVARWPAGARIAFGRIVQGWVYLIGRGVALEDQPGDGQLLAIFPLPRPGGRAPEVRVLSPLEAPLLRANEPSEFDRRIQFPVPPTDPTAREAEAAVLRIARGGPNALLDALSPEGAPTLRAWQVGLFEEIDYVSPQGDPTNPHIARTLSLIREVAPAMDCTAGDRCLAVPQTPLAAGAAPAQVMLRKDGNRVIIAALLAAAPAPQSATADGRETPWGTEAIDNGDDIALARALTLDGAVRGHVVGASRGAARAIAFSIGLHRGGRATRAYVMEQGHAPRPFDDPSLGERATDDPELHLRDYERDGGFELVSIGHGNDGAALVSIASQRSPATVSQRALWHRLDMLRATFGDDRIAAVDGHLRGFRVDPAVPEVACASLDRLAEAPDARNLQRATAGSFAVITFAERGQPLRGEPRRISARDMARPGAVAELLGPFAGQRCAALRCDWTQSYCQRPGDEGGAVLWFAAGGRRIAAISVPAR